ncbi:hypothetical protein E2C01_026673 [Portunus trituberculatus]|uniref:Uncharacterized protein n=1 Tax=Portunus trituberculatus TaxID=210409 RepID=A0A5B7EJ83_PORTR|nr:hypothetical protein [Portunus trituberculatus]
MHLRLGPLESLCGSEVITACPSPPFHPQRPPFPALQPVLPSWRTAAGHVGPTFAAPPLVIAPRGGAVGGSCGGCGRHPPRKSFQTLRRHELPRSSGPRAPPRPVPPARPPELRHPELQPVWPLESNDHNFLNKESPEHHLQCMETKPVLVNPWRAAIHHHACVII